MADFKYEIKQKLLVLSKNIKDWTKEFNIVSWNERTPKFDIREWSPEHDKMSKGITLSKAEVKLLRDVLNRCDLD